jgi:hypothetical protein|tara:strand:+ start:754 stop:1365 length:612 start_codon:yes stop_codon:yes gene_type:complete
MTKTITWPEQIDWDNFEDGVTQAYCTFIIDQWFDPRDEEWKLRGRISRPGSVPPLQTQQDEHYLATADDTVSPAAQDQATATLFDDVDRIVQQLETTLSNTRVESPLHKTSKVELTLAKAIQTLRPSTSNSPTEYNQDQGSTRKLTRSKEPAVHWKGTTSQEWELIQYMRSEGLSADKLTTFLSRPDLDLSLYRPDQDLREET